MYEVTGAEEIIIMEMGVFADAQSCRIHDGDEGFVLQVADGFNQCVDFLVSQN